MNTAVILLNWNQAADTIRCARLVQSWATDDTLIIVDNGSATPDREQLQAALPQARIIWSQHNGGFGGGNNLGMAAALDTDCESVLLLNNDALLAAADIQQLKTTLAAHPAFGAVGPVICNEDDPQHILSAGGRDIGLYVSTHHQKRPSSPAPAPVAYVPGTCILIRADVLRQVGLLDEAYFFGGEVADLCARIRAAGYLCGIDGRATATHEVERSSDVRSQLHIYYVLRNRFLYVRKFHAQQKWRLFGRWSWQGALLWLHALRHGNRERARAIWLGIVDGWNGRYGPQNERVTRGKLT